MPRVLLYPSLGRRNSLQNLVTNRARNCGEKLERKAWHEGAIIFQQISANCLALFAISRHSNITTMSSVMQHFRSTKVREQIKQSCLSFLSSILQLYFHRYLGIALCFSIYVVLNTRKKDRVLRVLGCWESSFVLSRECR